MVILAALDTLHYVLLLGLIVLGLGIIYGQMGVFNIAHGDFFTLGAYGVVVGEKLGLGFWGGLVIGTALAAGFGLLMYITVIRGLLGKLLMITLLATWGFGLIIRESLKWIFGPETQTVYGPFTGSLHLFGIEYPWLRIFTMVAAILALAGIAWSINKTRFGIVARAVIENRRMAQALGINVVKYDFVMFSLGTGVAGLAGAITAPSLSVWPSMGQPFLIIAFLVVIVVGLESVRRNLFLIVAGAVLLGAPMSLLAYPFSPVVAQVIVLGLAIVAVMVRPEGLFR